METTPNGRAGPTAPMTASQAIAIETERVTIHRPNMVVCLVMEVTWNRGHAIHILATVL